MPATEGATMNPATTTTVDHSPRVTFPDGFVVRTEIAADDETRAQGLMYRDQLRPGTGMLFFFPEPGEYPFWMRNTLIPLDMIWIDDQKKIVAMHQNVQPCRTAECPNYPPRAISRYVLEVAGGVAKEHGLKVGDVLRFENTDHIVAR
ncbi:MAG TPA: DUF192 domain-containing protein [Thermoanaerobaculia bacterium]